MQRAQSSAQQSNYPTNVGFIVVVVMLLTLSLSPSLFSYLKNEKVELGDLKIPPSSKFIKLL